MDDEGGPQQAISIADNSELVPTIRAIYLYTDRISPMSADFVVYEASESLRDEQKHSRWSLNVSLKWTTLLSILRRDGHVQRVYLVDLADARRGSRPVLGSTYPYYYNILKSFFRDNIYSDRSIFVLLEDSQPQRHSAA
ncbi:hypothetical protein BST61_g2733 [Cercospora zeina]